MTTPKAQTITYRTQEEQDELNKGHLDMLSFGQSVVTITKESAENALRVKHIPLKDILNNFTHSLAVEDTAELSKS